MQSPYSNEGHSELATYRNNAGWRVTLVREGVGVYLARHWIVVCDGTVTTRTGATAIEAMRAAGDPDPANWTYTP